MMGLFKALPKGAEAEFHTTTIASTSVRFNNNQFEGTSRSGNTAMTVRVMKDGRMSMSNSSKPGSHEEMLKSALGMVGYGTGVDYEFPGPSVIGDIELFSDDVLTMDFARMTAIGEELLDAVREYDPRIRASAGAGWDTVEVTLSNSRGFSGSYRKTGWRVSLGGQLIQGDDFLRLGESRGSWSLDIDYDDIKKEVIRQFEWARNTVGFEPGTYPVIFAPSQVGFLMAPFLACLNGKAFARGISPLKDRIGEELVDPRITLVDDGTLPREMSSAPFDREGISTRRNVLIDRGVASQLLLDLQTARELGKESTGNGSGSGPAPHHVLLCPGDADLDDMVRGIDRGILLLGSMGAWTGNPYGGNVTGTISLGLAIERGQIVGRVKDCMFSVNVFKHFREHLRGLTRETKRSGGGMVGGGAATLPYVALDDVVITTK